jgi:ATP-dependent RNA helicase RhlE
VNFELPNVPEDYVHRIGRTGRAEREGEAVSLVCVDEHKFLRDIEKLIKRDLDQTVIAGFEPDPSIRAEPIQLGRNTTIGRNNGGGGRSGSNSSDRNHAPRKPQGKASSGQAAAKSGAKPAAQGRNGNNNSAPKRASGNDSRGKSQSYSHR